MLADLDLVGGDVEEEEEDFTCGGGVESEPWPIVAVRFLKGDRKAL